MIPPFGWITSKTQITTWEGLKNPSEKRGLRIGMGCKARKAQQYRGYCEHLQRGRPPETADARSAAGFSDLPLVNLLMHDHVMTHPMIIGEIACGTPPDRKSLIAYFLNLQQTCVARLEDLLDFIARQQIYGYGCGLVDINVLLSALITPNVKLWTLDKRLAHLAGRFDMSYTPFIH